MIAKTLLRYSVFILIILCLTTFTLAGCKGILSRIAQQEPAEEESIPEEAGQLDIDTRTKLMAFEIASIYVIEKKPNATFETGYSEDKVTAESASLFWVVVDFSLDGKSYSWEILLEYDEQDDSFTVVEAPEMEGEVVQEPPQEEEPQKHPEEPQEEQPQESQDSSPEDKEPQEQTPQDQNPQQTPTEDEIKERAWKALQYYYENDYAKKAKWISVTFNWPYDPKEIWEVKHNYFKISLPNTEYVREDGSKSMNTVGGIVYYDEENDRMIVVSDIPSN